MQRFFYDKKNQIIDLYEVELIVYDETEHFRNWNHPEFNYPYANRKNYQGGFNLNFTNENDEYNYPQTNLFFHKSITCLQDPWWRQLLFFKAIFDEGLALIISNFTDE